MNPRIDDEVKKARGTFRTDRALPPAHEPGESKPRRPANMPKYAVAFWKKHFNSLWEQGWLSRQNIESFVIVCKLYSDIRELWDDIEKNGQYETVETQFTSKTVERPQWKDYQKLRNDLFKWLQECGITPASERRYLLGDKKDEKKKKDSGEKPDSIKDFLKVVK